jgi:very-short-patch-repair endonuclease
MPHKIRSIAETAPHLVADWHPTKNGTRTPETTGRGYDKAVWWQCATCGHEWQATPGNRTKRNPRGCGVCGGLTAGPNDNLAVHNPGLVAEWHPDNSKPPQAYRVNSAAKVRWLCACCGHDWEAAIYSRNRGHGCPVCGGLVPNAGTCLAATHPHLVGQWVSCEIDERTPYNTSAGSTHKVVWLCPNDPGHTWESSVSSRAAGSGCLHCSNKLVTTQNALATTHKELAKEWSPDNDKTADEVVAGSAYYAEWVCSICGRVWKARVHTRAVDGCGCRNCVSAITSRQEEHLRKALLEAGYLVGTGGKLIKAGVREWHCDIVDEEARLIVEFDGSYWHRGSQRTDRSKATNLRRAGWTVIRVREAPLEKLSEFDVVVPFRDPEAAARIVLEHLRNLSIAPKQTARACKKDKRVSSTQLILF